MRISDWSSDVCSSDLREATPARASSLAMRCSPLSECVLAREAGGRAPGLRTGFGRRDKADRGALRPGLSFFCGKRNYSFLARNQTGRQWRTTIYRGGSDLFLSWRVSGLMAQRKRDGNEIGRAHV